MMRSRCWPSLPTTSTHVAVTASCYRLAANAELGTGALMVALAWRLYSESASTGLIIVGLRCIAPW